MHFAITAKEDAPERAPFVLRGPYEDTIQTARRIGYRAIELHIHDSATLDRPGLKALLDDAGVRLTSIGTGTAYGIDGLSLANDDPAIRDRAMRRLADHMDTAKEHGAVVIIGLMKGLIRDCSSREACIRNVSSCLGELLKKAEADNVPLVLEVLNRYESDFLNTIEETLAFIKPFNSRFLQLHIDTFHMNIEEADIGAAIRGARGHIGHVHLADSDRWFVGHGHYDFGETIQALRDIGYERALAVESMQFPDPVTSATASFRNMQKYL